MERVWLTCSWPFSFASHNLTSLQARAKLAHTEEYPSQASTQGPHVQGLSPLAGRNTTVLWPMWVLRIVQHPPFWWLFPGLISFLTLMLWSVLSQRPERALYSSLGFFLSLSALSSLGLHPVGSSCVGFPDIWTLSLPLRVTLELVWVPPPCTVDSLQAVNWEHFRDHLICFFSLKDHS